MRDAQPPSHTTGREDTHLNPQQLHARRHVPHSDVCLGAGDAQVGAALGEHHRVDARGVGGAAQLRLQRVDGHVVHVARIRARVEAGVVVGEGQGRDLARQLHGPGKPRHSGNGDGDGEGKGMGMGRAKGKRGGVISTTAAITPKWTAPTGRAMEASTLSKRPVTNSFLVHKHAHTCTPGRNKHTHTHSHTNSHRNRHTHRHTGVTRPHH
jgi:hypothetical protein